MSAYLLTGLDGVRAESPLGCEIMEIRKARNADLTRCLRVLAERAPSEEHAAASRELP